MNATSVMDDQVHAWDGRGGASSLCVSWRHSMSVSRFDRSAVLLAEMPSVLKLVTLNLFILGPRGYPFTTHRFWYACTVAIGLQIVFWKTSMRITGAPREGLLHAPMLCNGLHSYILYVLNLFLKDGHE